MAFVGLPKTARYIERGIAARFMHQESISLIRHARLFLMLILMATGCSRETADFICYNAHIQTLDSMNTVVTAMAVRNGRIVALGSDSDILGRYESASRRDLQGRHVFPGFIDAHAHLFGLGEEQLILTLHDTQSPQEVASLVASRVREIPGNGWIRGRGWNQNSWQDKVFPTADILDAVAPDRPVFLKRIDGHAAWVNSKALSLAGISAVTPDPPGGRILRDARGNPTGILIDNAAELVWNIIPPRNTEEIEQGYRLAVEKCLSVGLIGIHDMGVKREQVSVLKNLIEKGVFPFRMVAYIDGTGDAWDELVRSGRQVYGENQLHLAGLKLYADGALGSRGARLLQEYSDDPGNRGIHITDQDTIVHETRRALDRGLQVCVHAIGDSANRMVLDAYQRVLAGRKQAPQFPLRIEHVQVLAEQDIPRFAILGVVPSMQPTHCTSDMTWAEARLGPHRVKGAYAWNSLHNAGSWIPFGSDFPVERPNPLWGIYAACTRRNHRGIPGSQQDIDSHFQLSPTSKTDSRRFTMGWYGQQRLTRMEALKGFTILAARAAGLDRSIGSLEIGKYADFVILSKDITAVPDRELLETEVLATYVGGRSAFPGDE